MRLKYNIEFEFGKLIKIQRYESNWFYYQSKAPLSMRIIKGNLIHNYGWNDDSKWGNKRTC